MAREKIDVEKILAEFESLENARVDLLENFMIENKEKLGMNYTDVKVGGGKEVKAVRMQRKTPFEYYYFIPDTKEYLIQYAAEGDYCNEPVQKSEIRTLDLNRVLKRLVEEYKYQEKEKEKE